MVVLAFICIIATPQVHLLWTDSADIPDPDGILSIKQKPFDVNGFVIGRDLHDNKFKDQQRGLKYMAECFMNMSDASDATKQDFKLAEKLGLSVVMTHPRLRYTGDFWMSLSNEEIDARVKQMIEESGNSKAIVGYRIVDEPNAAAFPKIAVAVEAVRKYAPGKMAAINLYPNYATLWTEGQVRSQLGTRTYEDYLEQFVQIVKPDMISYDNYMVQYSMDQQDRTRMAKHYTNIMQVREASLKYNIPWWNVVSSNQIRFHTVIPTLQNMMLQAYTSLAAGAGGIRWFTYWQAGYDYAPINANEQRTNTWHELREVNRHLSILGPIIKTLKSTGVYFTDPTIDPSLPLLPGKIVKGVESPEPLMIGEFESAKGNRYVMVVNINLERSARFVLTTNIENERLFVVSTGEETPYFREITSAEHRRNIDTNGFDEERMARYVEKSYWIPAGQGVLIRCSGMVDKK